MGCFTKQECSNTYYYNRSWRKPQRGFSSQKILRMEAATVWKTGENRKHGLRKCRVRGEAVAGEEGEVFPHVAAVAWNSARLKMTAFTLQLQKSCSAHLLMPHHWEHGHMALLYHNNLHTEESNYRCSPNTGVTQYCRGWWWCTHTIHWIDYTLHLHHCGHLKPATLLFKFG